MHFFPNSFKSFPNRFKSFCNLSCCKLVCIIWRKMEKTLPSSNASNASSNFSNFRNYPNYFRFPIYKFILQKNIFYFWKKLYPLQTLQTLQTPLPTFPISATTLIIFGFLFYISRTARRKI